MITSRREVLALAGHIGLAGLLPSSPASAAGDTPFLRNGFAPVLDELVVDDLPVRGALPKELAGSYFRNGPNPAYTPMSYTYPFDGDGMVHALRISDGRVSYRNRFVLTAGLRADRRAGRTIYGGLANPVAPDAAFVGPDGDPGPFKNLANTNVIRHAGRILALYEGGLPYELTPSLETKGPYDFAGAMRHAVTAHPKIDPITGELLMFRYAMRPPFLEFAVADPAGNVTRMAAIDTGAPYMVHDFAFTDRHVVFFLCPVLFDLDGPKQGRAPLAWQPQRGTRIAVLRRDGMGEVRWFEDDAFFVYHFMNAHEANGLIRVEYVQHGAFFTARGAPPSLWRATLDPAAGTVRRQQLDDRVGEFPRTDPSRSGRASRYGWLAVKKRDDAFGAYGALARYDMLSGTVSVHEFGLGQEVGEPVFVPRRNAASEGDGWIMAYVYDRATDGSILAVLDAVDLARPPVAEIVMPRRIPHGLHGNWLSD